MLQHSVSDKSAPDPYQKPVLPQLDERRLSKIAVLDVGSNSVRLVVFDGAARSPSYFYNEKLMCSLGAGLATTGHLNPEGKQRAIAAIRRFKYLTVSMGITNVTAVATAAVRNATDGLEFCQEVFEKTGQKIWIIDGSEEAKLSAQGVLLGWPGSFGLVCDVGGSSMELAEIYNGTVGRRVTSDLGPLKLQELSGGSDARRKYIRETITRLADEMGPQHNRLFLVGGSWRALARIDMQRTNYPLHVLHEYRMGRSSVSKTLAYLNEVGLETLQDQCSISQSRMSLLPYAGEVLTELLDVFEPKDIAISSYGLREGLLYQQMSDDIRARDPLIEACKVSEMKDARVPGMGKTIFNFVRPLFYDASAELLRIVRAACLLHDVSWRAHPDYRAEVCFDNATRANLGGLKHSERMFLALALMHRYTNKRDDEIFSWMFRVIDATEVKTAEILGKAMRLGAMLWVSDGGQRAELKWDPKNEELTLLLPGDTSALYGEVAETRLQSLSQALNAKNYNVVT